MIQDRLGYGEYITLLVSNIFKKKKNSGYLHPFVPTDLP
jgi:hypothetical protein